MILTNTLLSVLNSKSFPFSAKEYTYDLISYRRDAAIYKIAARGAFFSLKFCLNNTQQMRHEIQMMEQAPCTNGLIYASAESDEHPWLLMHWASEGSATTKAAYYREAANKGYVKKLLIDIADAVLRCHSKRILHGDLQPNHFILYQKKWALLDWGCAHFEEQKDYCYQGALVHYAAPEVAQQMLENKSCITYNTQAEVYSLSSVCYFLLTGLTSTDYECDDVGSLSMTEKLELVVNSICKPFARRGVQTFAEFDGVLLKGLSPKPADRYQSVAEFIKAVQQV